MSMIDPSSMAGAARAGRSRLDATMGGAGGAPTGQVPMTEANYRPAESPDRSCSSCVHFDGERACEIVAGPIDPRGVSDYFEPMQAAPVAAVGAPPAAPMGPAAV